MASLTPSERKGRTGSGMATGERRGASAPAAKKATSGAGAKQTSGAGAQQKSARALSGPEWYEEVAKAFEALAAGRLTDKSLSAATVMGAMRELAWMNDHRGILRLAERLEAAGLLFVAPGQDADLRNIHGRVVTALLADGQIERATGLLEDLVHCYPLEPRFLRLLATVRRYEDLGRAIAVLEQAAAAGKLASDVGSFVLYLDLLDAAGRTTEVRRMALRFKSQKLYPDLCLAMANLEAGAEDRLLWLNEFLRHAELQPLRLRDGAAFSLDSLTSDLTPGTALGPKVSVLMTTYNSADYVTTAVASIQAQTYRNWDLWIVDDASTDHTPAVLQRLAAQDPRITVLRQERNGGTYVAKNQALARCRGALVVCHDSDDWSHPQRLEQEVALLSANRALVATSSSWVRVTNDGKFSVKFSGRYIHRNPAALMFRREPVLERMGFFDSVRVGADTEFRRRMQLLFGGGAIADSDAVLTLGRLHENSLTQYGAAAMSEFSGSPVRTDYTGCWLDWHVAGMKRPESLRLEADGRRRSFAAPRAMLPQLQGEQQLAALSDPPLDRFARLRGATAVAAAELQIVHAFEAATRNDAAVLLLRELSGAGEALPPSGVVAVDLGKDEAGATPQSKQIDRLPSVMRLERERPIEAGVLVYRSPSALTAARAAGMSALPAVRELVLCESLAEAESLAGGTERAEPRVLVNSLLDEDWAEVPAARRWQPLLAVGGEVARPAPAPDRVPRIGFAVTEPEMTIKLFLSLLRSFDPARFELSILKPGKPFPVPAGFSVKQIPMDAGRNFFADFFEGLDCFVTPLAAGRALTLTGLSARLLAQGVPVLLLGEEGDDTLPRTLGPCRVVAREALPAALAELCEPERLQAAAQEARDYVDARFGLRRYAEFRRSLVGAG